MASRLPFKQSERKAFRKRFLCEFGSRTAVNTTGSQLEKERAANQPPGSSPRWPNASSPSFGVAASFAARLPQIRQRSLAGTRTDASAPRTTGQKHDRVSIRPGRCLQVSRNSARGFVLQHDRSRVNAVPNLPLPINPERDRTKPTGKSCQVCLWAAVAGASRLHSAAPYPQYSLIRCIAECDCLPGAAGLDKK